MNQDTASVTLVVADMAGTLADFGSCAPARAFVRLFDTHGIQVTDAQAREPMGMQKRDHIEAMLRMPAIAEQWATVKGSAWTESNLNALYAEFIPLQIEILPEFSGLVPGAAQTLDALRSRGVKVAATTGYNREMMEVVLSAMRDQGLTFDAAVCAEDVASGRPAPWMIFRAMELTGAYPPAKVVKIGDTIPDIEAGLRAGVCSVGVTDTGNMVGLNETEWGGLSESEQTARRAVAEQAMKNAGAHYVLSGIDALPPLIDQLNDRLAKGERP